MISESCYHQPRLSLGMIVVPAWSPCVMNPAGEPSNPYRRTNWGRLHGDEYSPRAVELEAFAIVGALQRVVVAMDSGRWPTLSIVETGQLGAGAPQNWSKGYQQVDGHWVRRSFVETWVIRKRSEGLHSRHALPSFQNGGINTVEWRIVWPLTWISAHWYHTQYRLSSFLHKSSPDVDEKPALIQVRKYCD